MMVFEVSPGAMVPKLNAFATKLIKSYFEIDLLLETFTIPLSHISCSAKVQLINSAIEIGENSMSVNPLII